MFSRKAIIYKRLFLPEEGIWLHLENKCIIAMTLKNKQSVLISVDSARLAQHFIKIKCGVQGNNTFKLYQKPLLIRSVKIAGASVT